MPTIATWNVNSIKARHDRFFEWLETRSPDVVCLQELKVADDAFPYADVEGTGYHVAAYCQKTWNGVAILSRDPIENVLHGMDDGVDDPEARVISGRTFGINVVGMYVPNGKTVGSTKWEYKMNWLDRVYAMLERRFKTPDDLVVCGDINIAPADEDVANPEKWARSVLCDPKGREKLAGIMSLGLEDVVRLHNEGPGPYSWWDYRMLAFPKGDGLRIDHILASEPLARRSSSAWVDREERKGKKPSDHAPVLATFD